MKAWSIFLGQEVWKPLKDDGGIGQKDIGTPTGQIRDNFEDRLNIKINEERIRLQPIE